MGGRTDSHVYVIEGGTQTSGVTIHPAPVPVRVGLRCDEFLTFVGVVGVSADIDAPVAYLNACLSADEYLTTAIFHLGLQHSTSEPVRAERGTCAMTSYAS